MAPKVNLNQKSKIKSQNEKLEEKTSSKVDQHEATPQALLAGELKNRLARALADYDNLIKRFARERDEITIRANKNLLDELLPVLDNIDRAQSHLNDKGLEMGLTQFKNALEKCGVNEIKVEDGADFDAVYHEAIDSREGGEAGKVAEVLVKGFTWRDGTVLRPAKVIVYKGQGISSE